MKKYFFSAILLTYSSLLMSQNGMWTNVVNTSDTQRGSGSRNWLSNDSESNTNKNLQVNRGNQPTNIANQTRMRSGFNESNQEDNIAPQRRTNPVVTQNAQRQSNPAQSQRRNIQPQITNFVAVQVSDNNVNPIEIQRGNLNEDRGGNIIVLQNIKNDDANPVFSNGNLAVNVDQVQNKQIRFLADNNEGNLQIDLPELDFSFENHQQTVVKTQKVKTVKTAKTFTASEAKVDFLKINTKTEDIAEAGENIRMKAKSTTAKKHAHGSYSQKNKNYLGKKIKIWCKKNLKFAKKIRASVNCPKF